MKLTRYFKALSQEKESAYIYMPKQAQGLSEKSKIGTKTEREAAADIT